MSPARTEPLPPAATAPDPFEVAARTLDAAGVRWSRLRDRAGGQEDDVLVDRADMASARRALASVGWRERRYLGHGSHRSFYTFDPVRDRWSKIDTVTELDFGRWQEWLSHMADGCLERSSAGAEGRTLTPDDAFWALLLHELLDRPGTPPRRGEQLRHLAGGARDDGPWLEVLQSWLPHPWTSAAVIAAAAEGNVERLTGLGISMRRRLGRRPDAVARRWATRALRWLDHRDPPFLRDGRTVAMLGPDGAGKSALVDLIGRGGPLPIRSVYLGLYGGSRARMQTRGLPGVGLARRLMAMWWGWLVGAWHARRGRLVLFDRHPYDARLAETGTGSVSGGLRRAVLGHALPAPDVVIVLDAPAEVLFARKPEHSLERIEAQRNRYLTLADRLGRAHVVDASAPIHEVARRITDIAWRGDGKRTEGR